MATTTNTNVKSIFNNDDNTNNTKEEEEEEEEERERILPLNENEKDAAWALEEFKWDSDKAIGKKITTLTTLKTGKKRVGGRGGGLKRKQTMGTEDGSNDDDDEEEEEEEEADVNDLRNSPRFRPMVRTSEEKEGDKNKYLEKRRKEEKNFTTDSADGTADDGARTSIAAAALATTGFVPVKLRSEAANGTKYRVIKHKVFCKVNGCDEECLSLYSIRVKVCVFHLKADEVMFNNELCRFCQKCTKFHNVGNFEEGRRACLRSLNRLAFKRVPASAQESALNTLAMYDRMIMSQAGTGEAAPNGGANSDSATNTDNNKREVSSVLPSNELTRQRRIRDALTLLGASWHQGTRKKERKERMTIKERNEEVQQQSQGTQIDQKTLSVSKLRVIRLQCAQMLLNHLPENFDPSTNAEERRRREIINASYTRSEGYDRLMHLDNEAFITLAAEIKIHNKQPHDLSASIGEGVKNYFAEKSGHPPARLEFTAEPGCTKLNVDTLIPPMTSRHSFLRNRRGTSDKEVAKELASYAIDTDDGGLDDVDIDVIIGAVRTRRRNGEWELSTKIRKKHDCRSAKHVMCTNPDILNSCENENTLIVTDVPPDVVAVVRINGQVERGSVIARFGGNSPVTEASTRKTTTRLNQSSSESNQQQERPDVLQNSQSNYVYVSVPLDYAEGLMTINLMWPEGHEFAGSALCDPIIILLTPDIDLAQELKEAMDEVHALSSEFCYTFKRYVGACLVKDGDVRSFTNPNFCLVQKDITLWALRNGFPKLSKRLLKPQVQMLENARSLAAADGVYKTYVYAATLSDSVEIVREVIALGGEKNLFGTVSTVGNKETRDTALHIAAMNGNTNMVLDFLSIVSSIESWFTSRNSSGFSPRDCAVLAQSSNLSKAITKVLDDPLLIASNAVCLAVKEFVSKVKSGAYTAPDHAPAIDHVEELENQSQAIFARASDLVFESLTEISTTVSQNELEEARKVATVRLLEITNMLLQHKACFLKLFSLAIERDCKLLESYNGADSMDKSFDSPIQSGADSFFVELLSSYDSGQGRGYVPQSIRKIFGKLSNALASLKYKSMLAFEDPLIEKAYVLENSFYRKRVDLVAFLLIFSVICARRIKFSDGTFSDFVFTFFRMGESSSLCFYISRMIGVLTFPGAIFALLVYPKFYTRHRESITMLVRYMSPLMWSLRSANETAPVSIARVMFMRSSACVYGCRFERHAFVTMMNYFFPFARMLKIFEGQAADLTFSTVVEDLDRNGCNRILSMGSIGLNLVVSFLVEARFRRKFAAKYGVNWMKISWMTSPPLPPGEDEKFIKDIREEVGAFDSDEEDDVRHKSLNRRNRFFKFISEQRKSLHAKAYFAFPNPRDEGAYVLENSNFRRPYDIAIFGYLYLIWGSELYRKYLKWGHSFDWYALSMFTNCDVTEDTMRITGYERRVSALFLLKVFSSSVLVGTSLIAIFLPRVYCHSRESFIAVLKLSASVAPALKVAESPEFVVVIMFRLCAVLLSVRFEREVMIVLTNAFIIPRALEWYVGTEEYGIIDVSGDSSVVTCKGNSGSLNLGIFSGNWYTWSSFFKFVFVVLMYLQISIVLTLEKQRREAFARKRRIKQH